MVTGDAHLSSNCKYNLAIFEKKIFKIVSFTVVPCKIISKKKIPFIDFLHEIVQKENMLGINALKKGLISFAKYYFEEMNCSEITLMDATFLNDYTKIPLTSKGQGGGDRQMSPLLLHKLFNLWTCQHGRAGARPGEMESIILKVVHIRMTPKPKW